jgi:hypothetical protein
MYVQKSRDAFSSVSNPNKYTNQFIEQIAELKRNNVDPNEIKEKAQNISKFNVKKWRENIEGNSAKKKAFNPSDNNIAA